VVVLAVVVAMVEPDVGEPVEVTPPEPTWVRVRTFVVIVKVAVTFAAAVTETVQVDVEPVQAPVQPVKTQPVAGVAVSTTEVL
jgi:hypothetical protein